MRRIAVQIDVQLRAADGARLMASLALEERRAFAIGNVVAQRAVTRRMMHVARVLGAQACVQRVAVGVLGGDQGEMCLAARDQRLRRAQRPDHARAFVGMLRPEMKTAGPGPAT